MCWKCLRGALVSLLSETAHTLYVSYCTTCVLKHVYSSVCRIRLASENRSHCCWRHSEFWQLPVVLFPPLFFGATRARAKMKWQPAIWSNMYITMTRSIWNNYLMTLLKRRLKQALPLISVCFPMLPSEYAKTPCSSENMNFFLVFMWVFS